MIAKKLLITTPSLLIAVTILLAACGSSSTILTPTTDVSPTFHEPTASSELAADLPVSPTPTIDAFTEARLDMVENTIVARGVQDPDVLRSIRTVPRHEFVPADYLAQAYADHPLPIGYGQTISQPFIVAWMTELLELQPGEKVLEIGTGSGYQAAVLAELGSVEVYSIEIVPGLAERAAVTLDRLGYTESHLRQGDGYYGWEKYAPFDAIIVTAAPDHLPMSLVQQLTDGGRLIIPIGPPGGYQTLWKFVREGEDVKAYNLGGVAFVPFTGGGVESEAMPEMEP